MHKETLGEQSKEVFRLWRVRDRFRKAAGLLPNSDSLRAKGWRGIEAPPDVSLDHFGQIANKTRGGCAVA